ncbi:MAG: hypothetical protein ABIH18_02280 [Candidatus Omnitrophota bacterium]
MVYLFIGQDSFSKDIKLKKIKQEFVVKEYEQFNFEIIYPKGLTLLKFQEKIKLMPLKSRRRVLVVKDAQDLKQDIKDFVKKYVQQPYPSLVLVLDISSGKAKDPFINHISSYSQVCRFQEAASVNVFALIRQIEQKRIPSALLILSQLLKTGEKPERIIGGFRYAWEKNAQIHPQAKDRIKILLDCDIDIKTGRLKAEFALEKLVIQLCSFTPLKKTLSLTG